MKQLISGAIRPACCLWAKRDLLIPREKIFFQFLQEESQNVLVGAVAFIELIQNFDHLADKRNKMKDIERHGDEIVHSIYDRLVKTFINPIDREDLSEKFSSSGC